MAGAGRDGRSTSTRTGTVQREATEDRAASRPRSVSTAGWMSRARSRSSWRAVFTSPWASSTMRAAACGSSRSFSFASPRSMARPTSRACAPSCRSRSMRRRSAAAVSTTTPRSDSSSTTRSDSSDGPSSPRTSSPSTVVRARTSHGVASVKPSPTSMVTVISNGLSR